MPKECTKGDYDALLAWYESDGRLGKSPSEIMGYKKNNKGTVLPATSVSSGALGSGLFGKNKVRTITKSQNRVSCKYCKGNGKCSTCKGNGFKFNVNSGHNDSCPTCDGRQRCWNCYGKGFVWL